MLLCGHESATVKSALACRTQSSLRFANRTTVRQVSVARDGVYLP